MQGVITEGKRGLELESSFKRLKEERGGKNTSACVVVQKVGIYF